MPQIHPSFSSAPILIIRNYISWASLPVATGGLAKGGLAGNWREGKKFPIAFIPLLLSLLSNLSSGCVPFGAPISARQPLPFGPSSHEAISQFQYLQEIWFFSPCLHPLLSTVSRALACLWLPAVANLCFSPVFCWISLYSCSFTNWFPVLNSSFQRPRRISVFVSRPDSHQVLCEPQCLNKGRGSCSSVPLCPACKWGGSEAHFFLLEIYTCYDYRSYLLMRKALSISNETLHSDS